MERKQAFLARIVNIGAELYAMAAVCVRARMDAQLNTEQSRTAYELADAFCRQAHHRADILFHELWSNTDTSDHRLARGVLDGRYAWQEAGVVDKVGTDLPWIAAVEPGPARLPNIRRIIPDPDA
jgi:hypothetical protein